MRVFLYFALLAIAAGLALARGTKVERRLALVLVIGNLATLAVVHAEASGRYASVSHLYFLTDVLVAVALFWIAIEWPAWVSLLIAAFQLNGTLGHLVKLAEPEIFALSYALMLKFWGWAMLFVLLASRSRVSLRLALSGEHWPSIRTLPDPESEI